jgi:hypothetical protein
MIFFKKKLDKLFGNYYLLINGKGIHPSHKKRKKTMAMKGRTIDGILTNDMIEFAGKFIQWRNFGPHEVRYVTGLINDEKVSNLSSARGIKRWCNDNQVMGAALKLEIQRGSKTITRVYRITSVGK